LAGVQACPLLQVTQTPALQTIAVPQLVPVALLPLSAHTEAPVAQEVMPVLQVLAGWQAVPAVQETHIPVLQTRFDPHDAPSESEVLVSVHTGAPVEQESAPVWQGLVGVHEPPAAQAVQIPLAQTWLAPQAVPVGLFPVTTQVEPPVAQDVVPDLQGSLG
jgi:hypothetical protein